MSKQVWMVETPRELGNHVKCGYDQRNTLIKVVVDVPDSMSDEEIRATFAQAAEDLIKMRDEGEPHIRLVKGEGGKWIPSLGQ